MMNRNAKPVSVRSLTSSFKIWLVGLIFFLVFFHLFNVFALPQTSILSEKLILGVVVALMAYLWIQEVSDRHRLEMINSELQAIEKRQQEAEIDMMSALILMEEAKNPVLHGHSQRVLLICQALANALGLPPANREVVRRACILHDLGKLAMPESIAGKRYAELSESEKAVIRSHPERAAKILEPLRFLAREKKIILHHHERFDGKGYPYGLKGEVIPLESRMIAVADLFDALNTSRLVQGDGSQEVVIEELRKFSGTRLDGRLVNQLLTVLERNPNLWKREAGSLDSN